MARKYTKKSEYWNQFSKGKEEKSLSVVLNDIEPALIGDPFYDHDSVASYARSGGSASTRLRKNSIHSSHKTHRFTNIREGLLPYEKSGDGYSAQDAIELCQKAYANVAIFRNAIDIMSEFSNADIYLEGGTKKSRDFFEKWMKYVKINKVKDQYFREYYRSGNVIFYKINAKFKIDDFQEILKSYAVDNPKKLNYPSNPNVKNSVPVQYVLLNPYYITARRSSSWNQIAYEKILSEYELERLQNPKNEHDKKVMESLPPGTREEIKQGKWSPDGITIQLDPTNTIYSFYKKQDYEPFAIPFGYGVLDDINFKLEMKKIDQAICRTIENVILLITMGAPPDKGGINHKNIKAMQSLLQNQSVGRVLVADYTTKADFIIPDMNKVLGYEKYKIVNEDIKEGLQNILIGSEKFANTTIKAQVFFERLQEARTSFIDDVLQPEMELIFKNLGFKGKCPNARFEEVSIKDETQFNRVVTRMMELGILPPEEGIKVIETGIYPRPEDLEAAQKKFAEQRKDGFYNPLVGGVPSFAPPKDPNKESKAPISVNNVAAPANKKPKQEQGRPMGATKASVYSRDAIAKVFDHTKALYDEVQGLLKKKYGKRRLNKQQKEVAEGISEAIIVGSELSDWKKVAGSIMKSPTALDKLGIMNSVQDLACEHDLNTYAAALLHHSSKISQD